MKKTLLFNILFLPVLLFGQNDLQSLINNADGSLVLEQGKTYEIGRTLTLPSNLKIDGNGSTVKPSPRWRSENSKDSPLIEIVDSENVTISNLNIDNMAARGINGMPAYSILLLKASNITISSVKFQDLGLPKSNKNVAGFPFVLIVAQEASNDFSYLPQKHKGVIGSVENVSITNCKFINNRYVNSFAIRLLTLWSKQRDKSKIKHSVNNILLQGNTFIGEYDWNTLEMAGPATKDIRVYANYFNGKSINNIDVDKGASDIEIRNNVVKNAGLPYRHRLNKNVRVSPIMVHGSKTSYFCENVIVSNNEIDGVSNPDANNSRYLYSSGIGVAYARNVTISNNKINGLFPNEKYGAAICLDQSIKEINVKNNLITDVNWGIVITPNTSSFNTIEIVDNDVDSRSESMMLLNGASGEFSGLTLKGNKVKSGKTKGVKMGTQIKKVDSDVKF